jgi:hypothetical protein
MGYRHEYVNHSLREYARGEAHINNCENRASILRPWPSAHMRYIQRQPRHIPKPIPTTEKHKQTTNNREDQANSKDIKTHQQTMD